MVMVRLTCFLVGAIGGDLDQSMVGSGSGSGCSCGCGGLRVCRCGCLEER